MTRGKLPDDIKVKEAIERKIEEIVLLMLELDITPDQIMDKYLEIDLRESGDNS